jgi:hypothetical protein
MTMTVYTKPPPLPPPSTTRKSKRSADYEEDDKCCFQGDSQLQATHKRRRYHRRGSKVSTMLRMPKMFPAMIRRIPKVDHGHKSSYDEPSKSTTTTIVVPEQEETPKQQKQRRRQEELTKTIERVTENLSSLSTTTR